MQVVWELLTCSLKAEVKLMWKIMMEIRQCILQLRKVSLCILICTINHKNKQIFLILHLGNVNLADLLIKSGSSINEKANNEKTPLIRATENGDFWNWWIESYIIFFWIFPLGHANVAQLLLKSGINVNEKDSNTWSPLHYAVWNGWFWKQIIHSLKEMKWISEISL